MMGQLAPELWQKETHSGSKTPLPKKKEGAESGLPGGSRGAPRRPSRHPEPARRFLPPRLGKGAKKKEAVLQGKKTRDFRVEFLLEMKRLGWDCYMPERN